MNLGENDVTRTGNRFSPLRNGVLGQFTRENETNAGLDFAGRDGRFLRIGSELCN